MECGLSNGQGLFAPVCLRVGFGEGSAPAVVDHPDGNPRLTYERGAGHSIRSGAAERPLEKAEPYFVSRMMRAKHSAA
jgi:hypothetical protein